MCLLPKCSTVIMASVVEIRVTYNELEGERSGDGVREMEEEGEREK